MIGDIALIRMRLAHKRPEAVWVWVGIDRLKSAASWHKFSDLWAHPHINIEPSDKIKELDLRFLVGLDVHLDGNDSTDRVLAAHLACLMAGAKAVFTYHNGELIIDKGEDFGVSATG